jgi:hypothetical protein
MSMQSDDKPPKAKKRRPKNRRTKQVKKIILRSIKTSQAGQHRSMDEFFLTEPLLFQPLTAEDLRKVKRRTGQKPLA